MTVFSFASLNSGGETNLVRSWAGTEFYCCYSYPKRTTDFQSSLVVPWGWILVCQWFFLNSCYVLALKSLCLVLDSLYALAPLIAVDCFCLLLNAFYPNGKKCRAVRSILCCPIIKLRQQALCLWISVMPSQWSFPALSAGYL